MTSGAPSGKWLEQYLKAKAEREAKEREEWERLSPAEREERLRKLAEENKDRSRLW